MKADYSFSSWESDVPSIEDAQNLSASLEEEHKISLSLSLIIPGKILELMSQSDGCNRPKFLLLRYLRYL